jgi:selenide, water dikinase
VRTPGGDLLVQTVDLIAPIVDDPAAFGRIAAANSLSDVYAMGGRPIAALTVACFPTKTLPVEVLRDIMRGAQSILDEAGCPLVGGHTVADDELKLGFSVSGVVEGGPQNILSIDRAQAGDVLILTKPLGTGVVNKAIRDGTLDDASPEVRAAVRSMTTLNARGAAAARAAGAHAATDVTGFGLLGHGAQFARASNVTFAIDPAAVPALDGVPELLARGVTAGRAKDNRASYSGRIGGELSERDASLLFDPQTSGGLLIALPESWVARFRAALGDWQLGAALVGRVLPRGASDVIIARW